MRVVPLVAARELQHPVDFIDRVCSVVLKPDALKSVGCAWRTTDHNLVTTDVR